MPAMVPSVGSSATSSMLRLIPTCTKPATNWLPVGCASDAPKSPRVRSSRRGFRPDRIGMEAFSTCSPPVTDAISFAASGGGNPSCTVKPVLS